MINLVVSERVLFAGSDDPGFVEGYGPVPADLARELAGGERAWLRRLYARPVTGGLVAMDSHARVFPTRHAELLGLRDQRCRTPWCDAPIRHSDHVKSHDHGGPTTGENGQGLCAACNHAKQAPGGLPDPVPGPATPSRRRPRPGTSTPRPPPTPPDRSGPTSPWSRSTTPSSS